MKCTCSVGPLTGGANICDNCFEVLIEAPRRKGAYDAAGRYSMAPRTRRIAFYGEHYAKPMPSQEYVYQVLLGKETV
jgi:hypothetical protein